ncbi:MAG: DNA polymerase I [Chloroflexi bacterium]|nr:DNA polymerase I [Chloroflexota bacterium]
MEKTDTPKNLLILIDGHAIVHRSFHAIQRPLTVSNTGEDVRGVYGFTNAFIKSIDDWKPSHVAITFDLPKPTFRHKMFDEYKAHRPPTPPELKGQFDRVRDLMKAFNVPIYELEGFEADDLLGTLSKQAESENLDTLILTGDSDTLQLVTETTHVYMSGSNQKKSLYDIDAVRERFDGLGPEYVSEIKALQGDSSDNIPGVPGIGIKTAIKLLTQFGSIENIYSNIDSITPPKAQKSLIENKDLLSRSINLTKIVTDVPIQLYLETTKFGDFNSDLVIKFLKELEFNSIIPKLSNIDPSQDSLEEIQTSLIPKSTSIKYTLVTSQNELTNLTHEISTKDGFSFDTETTGLNPMTCDLVGISISIPKGNTWYIPVGHNESGQLNKNIIIENIKPIFENPKIPIRAHNANYDISVLKQNGITVSNLQFDTMIAAHLSGRRNYGLKQLTLECFGEEMTPITNLIGKGRSQITMDEVPIKDAAPYAAADAYYTEKLYPLLKTELSEKNITKLYDEVEVPLIQILIKMQQNGVSLNIPLLHEMSKTLGDQLKNIESEMFTLIGHEFNLNSPKQLSDILFSELNLPPTRKIQSGHSTDAQSLDELKSKLDRGEAETADPRSYDVLNSILEYREMSKIKSTYVDSLPELLNTETNRVHTSYRQTGTATGRISSNDPNVQNIPVRSELGRRVRESFISKDTNTWSLISADYSQIELRVLAHFSKDSGLINAFQNGEDIHSATSALVYNIPISEVTSDMRRIAKILNFGVIYGLSAHGITRQTDLTQKQGKKFIEIYFEKYPGIKKYLDEVKEKCRSNGYVETLLGRRRYLNDINSSNHRIRSQAERAAINMPIQGTAADIIKIAMINIQQKIDTLNLKSLMTLQVHDELIFDVPNNEIEQMKSIITELMPNAVSLAVPLTVEMNIGVNWGELK